MTDYATDMTTPLLGGGGSAASVAPSHAGRAPLASVEVDATSSVCVRRAIDALKLVHPRQLAAAPSSKTRVARALLALEHAEEGAPSGWGTLRLTVSRARLLKQVQASRLTTWLLDVSGGGGGARDADDADEDDEDGDEDEAVEARHDVLDALLRLDAKLLGEVRANAGSPKWALRSKVVDALDEYYRASTVLVSGARRRGGGSGRRVLARFVLEHAPAPPVAAEGCEAPEGAPQDLALRLVGVMLRPESVTPVWRLVSATPSPPSPCASVESYVSGDDEVVHVHRAPREAVAPAPAPAPAAAAAAEVEVEVVAAAAERARGVREVATQADHADAEVGADADADACANETPLTLAERVAALERTLRGWRASSDNTQ